jgi:hypothetical protein
LVLRISRTVNVKRLGGFPENSVRKRTQTESQSLVNGTHPVLPLFDTIEAVQLTALRYTLRKPHGLNLPRALKRVRRLQREFEKLRGALQSDLDALPR